MKSTNLVQMMIDYMRRNGINQKELGRLLNVNPVTVHHWLSGKNGITRANALTIEALCTPRIHQQGSGHAVMSVYGDANGGGVAKSALDALERRVLEEDGICAECKLAFLRMIKEVTR